MTMLIAVSSSTQPPPPHQQHHQHLSPPPTLPKPGKDNLRLQRLLKKAAKKNAVLASEQAKPFRSSLSPVNEASPDLEHDESAPAEQSPQTPAPSSSSLPTRVSIKPITQRVSSPFRRSKPFTLKVTEQRRIAEHIRLTSSSAMPLLHKPGAPEAPQQPEGTDTHLSFPPNPSVSLFSQPPPSSPASKEKAPEVTYVTKVHTSFHSVKPPRAKTPTPNQAQGTVSQEDKRSSSPIPKKSPSEPSSPEQIPIPKKSPSEPSSPEQIPNPLDDSKAKAPPLEPPFLPTTEAEPPNQAPRPAPTEDSIKAPSASPSDTHTDKPTIHGGDTKTSGSEKAPESPKQDGDILKPSTLSAPWKQAHPAPTTPAQAHSPEATSTDTKVEQVTRMTPSLANPSPPLKAQPAPSSSPSEAARPAGANSSGWHRLRKHLMVQPEASSFPEPELNQLGQEERSKETNSQAITSQDGKLFKSKAMRMWDAIFYQLTVSKEKQQQQQAEEKQQKEESFFLPRRLPLLLHKPRFDARKLKELASKPMTKLSSALEASRLRPGGAHKHAKSFNRTAAGWAVH